MDKPLLGFPNLADTATVSGGSWLAGMPLTHLAQPKLHLIARSTDATLASTTFDLDLGYATSVRIFALIKHTLSRLASVRFRGSTVAGDFSTPVYDSGWVDAWPVVYPLYDPAVGGPGWLDGRYTDTEIAGYQRNTIHLADQPYSARYWRVEISDTANPAGYVDVARFLLAPGWQPSIYFAPGFQIGWESPTTMQRSEGGAKSYAVRKPYRVVRFQFQYLDEDEALVNPFEINRQLGLDGQFLFVRDPDDTLHLFRLAFLATLRQLSPLEAASNGLYTAAFEAEEVL